MKRSCSEIMEAVKIPEFYKLLFYLVITGFLTPSFYSFGYYFMLDVAGISKFSYSMLTVLGYVTLLLGTQLFNKYFKESEFVTLFFWKSFITLLLAPLTFLFVLRINVDWGIPDLFIIILKDTVISIAGQSLSFLPMSIIFAKICP